MSDPDTFLTALYVAVDEMLAASPPVPHPGPRAGLWPSEVVTLALFSQWARFGSERDFYGYATAHLHAAFPKLPSRTQLNRLIRRAHSAIVQVSQTLAAWLGPAAYEILDGTGVPVRNRQRRGAGWLPDRVAIGRCARLGWFEGFRLLLDITPHGAITGYGLAAANANDRQLAERFLAQRARPDPTAACVGVPPASGVYLADSGFSGVALERRYQDCYGATVVCPPQTNSRRAWSPDWRLWLAQHRQLVETVIDRLLRTFRLAQERPHTFAGFDARLAAKMALHNFCLWFNIQRGQPPLTIATVLGW
jgi:hypothetical protein